MIFNTRRPEPEPKATVVACQHLEGVRFAGVSGRYQCMACGQQWQYDTLLVDPPVGCMNVTRTA